MLRSRRAAPVNCRGQQAEVDPAPAVGRRGSPIEADQCHLSRPWAEGDPAVVDGSADDAGAGKLLQGARVLARRDAHWVTAQELAEVLADLRGRSPEAAPLSTAWVSAIVWAINLPRRRTSTSGTDAGAKKGC